MSSSKSPSSVITTNALSSKQVTVTFGEYPIKIVCPECHEEMKTKTTAKIGSYTWILVLLLFFSFPLLTPL